MKIHRPVPAEFKDAISQRYGVESPMEPLGFKHPDGVIEYQGLKGSRWGHWHNGIDWAVPCGTEVFAVHDGTVAFAGEDYTGFGQLLRVRYHMLEFWYGHLMECEDRVGAFVRAGQQVARSGGGLGDWRDGNSTGCHLHLSVYDWALGRFLPPHAFLVGDGVAEKYH